MILTPVLSRRLIYGINCGNRQRQTKARTGIKAVTQRSIKSAERRWARPKREITYEMILFVERVHTAGALTDQFRFN